MASAQPSGQAAFAFGPDDAPVWDLSGPYSLTTPLIGAGGAPISLSYSVQINHDARGTLSGDGTTIVRIADQPVAVFYSVRGSVTGGGGGATRANFSITLRGRDWISGALSTVSIRATYRLEVDAQTMRLVGRVRGNSSISGHGGASMRDDDFSMPLPLEADGTWAVAMNFIPFKSFVGTASIYIAQAVPPNNPPGFPEDRVMAASVRGSYSPARDLTRATVQALYEDRGASLTISFLGENTLSTIRGKILGQTVRLDATDE